MIIKRFLAALAFLVFGGVAYAQTPTANVEATGYTDSLNITTTINTYPQAVNRGYSLWVAVVAGDGVYFYSDAQGFQAYDGGLTALLSSNPHSAPAVRAVANTYANEVVSIKGWNTRSILGGALYVGYGTTFADMVGAARYAKVHTFTDRPPSVEASQATFYCYNPYTYIYAPDVAYTFTVTNATPYTISTIHYTTTLLLPSASSGPFSVVGSAYYTIPGGVAPGASTGLNLVPNMFSSFAAGALPYCGVAARATLSVRVTSAEDAAGQSHTY